MDLKLLWELSSLTDEETKKRNDSIVVVYDPKEALDETIAVAIVTEWEQFKNYNWSEISQKKKIFDGRKIIPKKLLDIDTIYSLGS